MMSEQRHPAVQVKCTSCGKVYPPDLNAGPKQWECPHCGSENTNLKGRYRVLALACRAFRWFSIPRVVSYRLTALDCRASTEALS
jgi:predicted RNA-binding Zn-ribbon protein involved in translation (DUF1610 family)